MSIGRAWGECRIGACWWQCFSDFRSTGKKATAMSKYEKEWPHDNCDECGSDLLIRTDCPDEGLVHDGDDAYCPYCKRVVGTISLEDEGDDSICHAWVNQFG